MAGGVKKKFAADSDLCGNNVGFYRLHAGRRASYLEYFGFWLNRQRHTDRLAFAAAKGHGLAAGTADPGEQFWRNVTDGLGEALAMKARFDMRRNNG